MNCSPDVYFSFFMFEPNVRLYEEAARSLYVSHMRELVGYGYSGFELHTGRTAEVAVAYPNYSAEVAAYVEFRRQLDSEGLQNVALATNVGATTQWDPSSLDPAVRQAGLEYLRSRVDITAALGGEILMGPVVIPYGAFVHRAPNGEGVWSDALQDELSRRYEHAASVLEAVGQHAARNGVKVAIEPITHWETPGPNTLAQLMEFLEKVPCAAVGAIIDSAHEVLDGAGPECFEEQVQVLSDAGRLHYAQASPPDRGTLCNRWIPWEKLFGPLLRRYSGPVAIEIFNAVPLFAEGLRLSRRKYWVPGVDEPGTGPSAYQVARQSLEALRSELGKLASIESAADSEQRPLIAAGQ